VIDFKCTESFPEYQAILTDKTTEDNEVVKNKKDAKVYWSKIMRYKFVRSQPDKLFFKYFYSSPECKFTTIYKKLVTRANQLPTRRKLYRSPIGIQSSKKNALLKLCHQNLIPQEHWNFFEDLAVNSNRGDEDSETDGDE